MSGGWLARWPKSWHGRNHHNFNEQPGSPKVGREARPRRRVCRIDPLVPNMSFTSAASAIIVNRRACDSPKAVGDAVPCGV
jgi:hypothetical protein